MYRKVGGVALSKSRIMSIHSFGAAIDINPGDYDNDYFLGKGNDLRDKSNPYCIPDEVIAIFEKYGFLPVGWFPLSIGVFALIFLLLIILFPILIRRLLILIILAVRILPVFRL